MGAVSIVGCRAPGSGQWFEYDTLNGERHIGQAFAMRVVVGADDEGAVADAAVDELVARGHDVTVLERRQWPDIAAAVAHSVAAGAIIIAYVWASTGFAMVVLSAALKG